MSNTNQEKIKQAVDLLVDKDTDLTSFFAKVPTYCKIMAKSLAEFDNFFTVPRGN